MLLSASTSLPRSSASLLPKVQLTPESTTSATFSIHRLESTRGPLTCTQYHVIGNDKIQVFLLSGARPALLAKLSAPLDKPILVSETLSGNQPVRPQLRPLLMHALDISPRWLSRSSSSKVVAHDVQIVRSTPSRLSSPPLTLAILPTSSRPQLLRSFQAKTH